MLSDPVLIDGDVGGSGDPIGQERVDHEAMIVEIMETGIETHERKPLSGKIRERDERGRLIFLQKDGTRRSPFDRPRNTNHKRRRR